MEDRLKGMEKQLNELADLPRQVSGLLNYLSKQSGGKEQVEVPQPKPIPVVQAPVQMPQSFDQLSDSVHSEPDVSVVGCPDSVSDSECPDDQTIQVVDDAAAVVQVHVSSFKARLAKYEDKVNTHPPVSEDLASFVSKSISSKMEKAAYNELSEKYARPENIPFLVAPKVNREVWNLIPEYAQKKDLRLAKQQNQLVQGICPLVKAIEECGDSPQLQKIKGLVADGVELLSQVSMDMNYTRRDTMRPELKKASHLASRSIPVTDQLFGDDVEAEFKKIESRTKLSESMRGQRYTPYQKPSFTAGSSSGAGFSRFKQSQKKPFLVNKAGNISGFPASSSSNFNRKPSKAAQKWQGQRKYKMG